MHGWTSWRGRGGRRGLATHGHGYCRLAARLKRRAATGSDATGSEASSSTWKVAPRNLKRCAAGAECAFAKR